MSESGLMSAGQELDIYDCRKKTVCSQSVINVCRKECFISFCERQECLFYISMNRKQMASSVYDTWPVKLLLLNLL